MKKNLRVLRLPALVVLAMALTLPAPLLARAATDPNPVLRIGLYYGNAALPAANLQNQTGAGYRMGYLAADKSFVEVGRLDAVKITMLKNHNIYFKNGEYSDVSSSGAVTVGCWHIDTGRTFADFTGAKAYADTLRGQGLKAFPVYSSGVHRVRVGAYSSKALAEAGIPASGLTGATALSGSAYCVSVVTTDNGDIVFQFDGGESRHLAVWPSLGETSDPITWFKGYRYRGGFEYRRVTGNNMTVINWVNLQDYVKGVIPYEMNAAWHVEALKAQTLCAKSFAMTSLNKHQSQGFDICNTTDCQVYYGTGSASANSDRAVDETYGKFIYYNNTLAQTVYHSCDGGSTESSLNVWGTAVPYLQAVTDIYETYDSAWTTTYTNNDITQILKEKGVSTGSIVNAYVDQFTAAGNVYRLTVVDSSGNRYNFDRERARTMLNSSSRGKTVYSLRYTVTGGSGGATLASSALTIVSASGNTAKNSTSGLYAITGSGIVPLNTPIGELQIRSKSGISALPAGGSVNTAGGGGSLVGSGTYTFRGTGRGHNVGMSQYGAKAMADSGFTAEQIIRFYFTGVTIQ